MIDGGLRKKAQELQRPLSIRQNKALYGSRGQVEPTRLP